MKPGKTLLSVQNLSISFRQYRNGFRQAALPVIRDLNLSVGEGELVAVVGSSGSGKSLLAHGILGLLPYNATREGGLFYDGEQLTSVRQRELRGKEIVLVPQSVSYLDPLMKIGPQVRKGKRDPASRRRGREVLDRYGLGEEVENQYPFELSGGMTRRVLIATAVQESPRLVIADEPTPGLHVEIARRVLGHFRELADEGAGVLLITHDLELALEVADRIAVFYAGTTVEDAAAGDFAREEALRHPYTRALWRAMPEHGFHGIPGAQPYPGELTGGCPFAPRCGDRTGACGDRTGACGGEIPWRRIGNGSVRCVNCREGMA